MEDLNNIKDTYPQWLINLSFDDWFDWKKGIFSTFSRFLEYATLHDSYWCGIFSNLDNSINLIVNFDAFWNKEIANHPGPKVDEWPYLIIKLERVFNLTLDSNMDCGTTIGELKTELISDDQKEKIIDNIGQQYLINSKIAENILDKKVSKTMIEDVCGGFIEIIHTEPIRLLLYESNGNLIELPEEMKVIKEE